MDLKNALQIAEKTKRELEPHCERIEIDELEEIPKKPIQKEIKCQ